MGEGACHSYVCMPKKAIYLLAVREQFAEFCQLLRSVTVASTLPDILHYLFSRPEEKQPTIKGF